MTKTVKGVPLLARLVPLISSRVEVAVTEALGLLLAEEETVRERVVRFCAALLDSGSLKVEQFTTQYGIREGSGGAGRPDLVGMSGSVPIVLVELKFWAGLTEHSRSAISST